MLSETENGITTEYIYDALGNLTKKTDNTGTTTYVYDALNRLTEVVNSNGTWQRNTYDASGIRATLCENGITTEYMTLNGMVLAGYDKGGERREHYFYGSSILGEELSLLGTPIGTPTGTDTEECLRTFYLKNSHGDIIGQTDENGTLTKSYAYNAFGTLIHSTALDGLEDTMSRFLYSGEQYDTISGLYYLRARHYDTEAGRFNQEDTYLGDGRNLYAYVHNNPVMYTDPSGHLTVDYNDGEVDDDIQERQARGGQSPMSPSTAATTGGGTYRGGTTKAGLKASNGDTQSGTTNGGCDKVQSSGTSNSTSNVVQQSGASVTNSAGNTMNVGEYLAGKAPTQVTPGTRYLEGQYVNDQGKVQPWKAYYDEYGRLIARTDYNAGNIKHNIPSIHYHLYEWGPGKTPFEYGSHIEGVYMP